MMSSEYKIYYHMFCNDWDSVSGFAYETDSGIDNASCSAESTSTTPEEESCKCTELQNPSIMQYYPAWAVEAQIARRNQKKKKCDCKVEHVEGKTKAEQAKESDITDYYESDTDGELETGVETKTLMTGSLKVTPAGLPKNLHDVQLSVILIGDSNTGKTSLVARFADDKLIENYETTIGKKVIYNVVELEVDVRSEIEKGVFYPAKSRD